jgi:hypothetical protein
MRYLFSCRNRESWHDSRNTKKLTPQTSIVMNISPRISFLVTTLCSIAFFFASSTPASAAKPQKVVGTVKAEPGVTVTINGSTAEDGAALRCGDVIVTTQGVTGVFNVGPAYIIDPSTKVRIVCNGNGPVSLLVVYGGVRPVDGGDDVFEQIPYNAALGVGNNTFPSIGGGGDSSFGKIPILKNGVVVGYALTDANGKVVAFTNVVGGVLSVPGPNGTPVSRVFGAGAAGANLS